MNGKEETIVNHDGWMDHGASAKSCPTMAIVVHAGIGRVTAAIKAAIRGAEPACECAGKPSDQDQPDVRRARELREFVQGRT